jgi:hypothetical protein
MNQELRSGFIGRKNAALSRNARARLRAFMKRSVRTVAIPDRGLGTACASLLSPSDRNPAGGAPRPINQSPTRRPSDEKPVFITNRIMEA